MFNQRRIKSTLRVNAGSMADIAFLLLIFFLISTTITVDKGIAVKLPAWNLEQQKPDRIPERNLFEVKLNGENQLLVEDNIVIIHELSEMVSHFLTNPQKLKSLPDSPKKAVISLQNDRGTEYEVYLKVYNEILVGYKAVWEEVAQNLFKRSFNSLASYQQQEIRKEVPLVILEANLTAYAEE